MRLSPSYNEDNDDDNVTIIMASLTFFLAIKQQAFLYKRDVSLITE